ncbi:MAG TPA: hypothetical protein VF008_06700 [Niastella sp.]
MKVVNPVIYLIALLLIVASCNKNSSTPDTPSKKEIQYVFANVAGVNPSQTTYVMGTTDLNFTNLTSANGAELAGFASMWQYKQSVYLTAFGAPASITKYTFDDEGKVVIAGKLIVPGANSFSTIEFINDSVAYASVGGGLARVIQFNPALLQITGEVNLSTLLKTGAASTYYLGMKARSGKLFMGVHYFNSSFSPLYDSAYVAVIDMATNKVDKLISDGRTCAIFQSGSSVNGFELDANGDIYIEALGSANVPSGILRIKSGETNFDPTYFFDLKAVTGKDCRNLWHFGSGLTFTTCISDVTDPYESKGPNFEYYKIDLAAKTATPLTSLPKIFGSSTSIMRKVDANEILFVVAGSSENAIYSYTITGGTITKKFTLSGSRCTGFAKIK